MKWQKGYRARIIPKNYTNSSLTIVESIVRDMSKESGQTKARYKTAAMYVDRIVKS